MSIGSNSQFLPRQHFLAHSQRLPGTVLLGRPFAQRALSCVLCGVRHAASAGSLSVRFDAPCVPHGESSDGSAAPFGAKHVAYDALPVLPLYLRAPYYPPCLTYNLPILGCSRSGSKNDEAVCRSRVAAYGSRLLSGRATGKTTSLVNRTVVARLHRTTRGYYNEPLDHPISYD